MKSVWLVARYMLQYKRDAYGMCVYAPKVKKKYTCQGNEIGEEKKHIVKRMRVGNFIAINKKFALKKE